MPWPHPVFPDLNHTLNKWLQDTFSEYPYIREIDQIVSQLEVSWFGQML
jgi:hypothetical protein